MAPKIDNPRIAYSCYYAKNREGEQFVSEHVFSYQISGTLTLSDGEKQHIFSPGDFRLIRRNQLVKFLKEPPPGGEFRSVSVYLDQQTLRNMSVEHDIRVSSPSDKASFVRLAPRPLLKSYMDSLSPYNQDGIKMDPKLVEVKLHEAIFILLQGNPELKDMLFDFSDPIKTDLKAFMEKNFHFNVPLERFAYLTGRSLATFKRDFQKILGSSPSKWLQQRRLHEAHYQISEKGRSASEIYLELGFENLSHFSFAFKNKYGVSPSRL
ncbi:AraC family transcriptional regulator [Pedobacter frigiditerrae]|uniref:AraC family transcriptional regulator n=1 Tax=Pedobacter frigiditerrae TaxID=2530452 RepID=UPI0029313B77|nr:AraC family transcriptional regulator [Pedobacter frigiditerrae]